MIVNVRLFDMPTTIKSYVRNNDDDSYTIILNARLSYEQQRACCRHELEHINRLDFYARKCADEIENERHGR